jgi:hypothetical protein
MRYNTCATHCMPTDPCISASLSYACLTVVPRLSHHYSQHTYGECTSYTPCTCAHVGHMLHHTAWHIPVVSARHTRQGPGPCCSQQQPGQTPWRHQSGCSQWSAHQLHRRQHIDRQTDKQGEGAQVQDSGAQLARRQYTGGSPTIQLKPDAAPDIMIKPIKPMALKPQPRHGFSDPMAKHVSTPNAKAPMLSTPPHASLNPPAPSRPPPHRPCRPLPA